MKFLLTSAGIKNSSIEKALSELVEKSFSEISVAFIPTAATMLDDDKSWMISNLNDFIDRGFKSIDIVDISAVPKENWLKRLESADILCFGGGDEQYLARMMRESGVADELSRLLVMRVYMGISAGSMVAGKLLSQDLMKELIPEEVFDGNESGLGILDFSILPHLDSDYFAHLRMPIIQSLAERFPQKTYALDDASALKIENGMIDVVSEGRHLMIEK